MVNTNLVSIKINNIPLQVPEGTRILDACRDNGFHVPYLCYLKDINEIGACRVCVVEVKGIHHLVTSCNNQVQEGMEILTNSPRSAKPARSTWNCFFPSITPTVPPVCAVPTVN
ncbi:2Fe-2S iron-sulfur cluster-binding protein [Clostridium sp. AF22-10]|uniref:2Fe-2S iron-sulfur cluster-binding protein n=1 Tax=Clostridium sp. AF22-10 TaxID=2293004 RepID=UPI0026B99F28